MNPINNFSKKLAQDAQNKWKAFCDAIDNSNTEMPNDFRMINMVNVAKQVFAFSDFVAKNCVHNPTIFCELAKSGDLTAQYNENEYNDKLSELISNIEIGATDNHFLSELQHILRKFRIREMTRIAWRDIAGWSDLEETMTDLSNFADSCIKHALSLLHKHQCLQYGVPTGTNGAPQYLVILGMGKLGARELNFSSDIDLIFSYPTIGKTENKAKSITNEEFFTKLCRCFLNALGKMTSDGIVFRVDVRLRPYGESGPLAMNFDNMVNYYQMQGREWERYALIKARVITDENNFHKCGLNLLEKLKPFVFRKYLDFGVFESLRDMKQQIILETKHAKIKDNIKLGAGGIREIEFFGQIFQLIRGGVTPILQTRRIQKTLTLLAHRNYIPQSVCDELLKAYIFLRKTENRLQEFSDRQTHKLPSDILGKERLAKSMGFAEWETFVLRLAEHTKNVHNHFDKLLKTAKPEHSEDVDKQTKLKGVWLDITPIEQNLKILSSAGFKKPDDVIRLLEDLRTASVKRSISIEGRKRLDKIMPIVLLNVGVSRHPDIILIRIIELLKTIARRSCYIALLLENLDALTRLIKFADESSWIISFVTRHPVLLDELLDNRIFCAPPTKDDLAKQIQSKLESVPSDDIESQIEQLCVFKQANILRVAAAEISGILKVMKVSDHLTNIAETVVNKTLEIAWNSLIKEHGAPVCHLNGEKCGKGFVVIAYGKLGGIELGYNSDLDLVFLHAGAEGKTTGKNKPIDNAQFFARLGQKVIRMLTIYTSAGRLYETDMRLRPSGNAGLLVSHIETFKEYQIDKAWTWEHQAILRARAISGDIKLIKYFEQIRRQVIAIPRKKEQLQKEVSDMRERLRKKQLFVAPEMFDLKQGVGAIVDIEFLTQYLALLYASERTELLEWTDNVRLLETLFEIKAINASDTNLLKDAYLTYRTAVHSLSLQEKPAMALEKDFCEISEQVKKIWDFFINACA